MDAAMLMDYAIDLLTEIDTTPSERRWCQQYSVYDFDVEQRSLEQKIQLLVEQSYKNCIVISNYCEIIKYWNMNEQDIAAANSDWLSRQPYLCTLASISWHFRRDYFCEGSLIHQSIASGVLLRLFSHLKTLCPTAAPALTINELMKDNCEGVPDKSGIYWILVPDGMTISFDKRIDDMHKFYPVEKLLRKYENCSEREILYIGKAEGTKGLRQRLKQYMKFGQGKGNIHRGGRAIWQIEHFGFLLVAYEVCENAEYREKQLLQEYKMRNGTYPLANWRG